jgi:hypothetical protein
MHSAQLLIPKFIISCKNSMECGAQVRLPSYGPLLDAISVDSRVLEELSTIYHESSLFPWCVLPAFYYITK